MARPKSTSARSKAPRKKSRAPRRPRVAPDGRQASLADLSTNYINLNYMKFSKKYPGEYIIALGNRIISHGADLTEVEERAKRKAGDKIMSAVLDFLPENVEDMYAFR